MLNHSAVLDRTFFALSAHSRRAILERLGRGPAPVSELVKPLAISLAATMQHLKVLEESGLVLSVKAGRVRTCRLSAEGMTAAERWFADRRAAWERHFDRLGEFLAGQDAAAKPAPRKPRVSSSNKKVRR